MIVHLNFDGGCRSNPNGPASSGAVLRDAAGLTLIHVGRDIGVGSNNIAEWTGLLIGLEAARNLGATEVCAFGDSELVVKQFNGEYAIRDEKLRALSIQVSQVARSFEAGVTVRHIPRKQNAAADAICTAVLEGTYVPDSSIEDVRAAANADERVAVEFVVEVQMGRDEARRRLEAGATPAELRRDLGKRAESSLLLAGTKTGDAFKPARIKG
jgi:ribonuclease HI